MYFTKFSIVFIVTQLWMVNAARILGIFAFPGPTQYAFVEPLLKELARRGHHITSISNFPQTEPVENFRDIVIKENRHLFDEYKNFSVENVDRKHYDVIDGFLDRASEMTNNVLYNSLVTDLKENASFDIILMDALFSEALFGFAEHFRAPIVGISSWGTMTAVDELVGNTTPLSYIPNIMIFRQNNQKMNFWRRCLNVVVFTLHWIHYYYRYFPVQEQIYKHNFPNASKTLREAQKNFSLVLVNDHFTISTPRPYVTNMIEVAGMHIPSQPDPIPKHIEELFLEAKQGVIYTTIDPLFPQQTMQMILNQFGQYQQLVIWNTKYKVCPSLHIPSNVRFYSNLSHHAILSHSNINLFISHGDYLSFIDSIHYGIPILGIHRYNGHQDDYVDSIKKLGNGLSLSLQQLNERTLSRILHDLLDTDHYRIESKQKSHLFRDQQIIPIEKAIYWIEYVVRHRGAEHLRNLGQNLSVLEFYNLDVYLMLFFVVITLMYLSYLCLNLFTKLFMHVR